MNDGRRRDSIMGFIFWGFIVLFFFLVYPQIFLTLIHTFQSAEAHWLFKPGLFTCIALALSIVGVSVTTLLVSGLIFFGLPILYRAWCKINIRRYFSYLRTSKTKKKTPDAKPKTRSSVVKEKNVKVLFSNTQKKDEIDANHSDSSAHSVIETRIASIDKGQQTSREHILSNAKSDLKNGRSPEKNKCGKVKTVDVGVQEEMKTADVGVQAMRPDTMDPRIEARINILESRLRLEELRNRGWCARMAETEECLTHMRLQMRKWKSEPARRVVNEGTNTSAVNLVKHETILETPRSMDIVIIRDQGDNEPPEPVLNREPHMPMLYPTETNVYFKEGKVQQVDPNEPKVSSMVQRVCSAELNLTTVYQKELKTMESITDLNLMEDVTEKALIKVDREHLALTKLEPESLSLTKVEPKSFALTKVEPESLALTKVEPESLALTKVEPESLALTKVDPEGLALTKVDPASRQVKPWKAPQTFPTPLPDDTIYSQDFNTLLRRLRAEIGESTWARVRTIS